MRTSIALLALGLSLVLGAGKTAYAEQSDKSGKLVSLSVISGAPHLIGLELGYIGFGWIGAGFSFGFFPLNSLLQNVSIPATSVTGPSGENYQIVSSTTGTMTSTAAYLRWFPGKGGLFLQGLFAAMKASGNLSGTLQDADTGSTVLSNAVSGSVNVDMPVAGLAVGYQFFLKMGMFFHGAIGLNYRFDATHSTSVGGSATQALAFIDGGQAQYDAAVADVNTQVASAVNQINSVIPLFPTLFIGFGYAF